MTYICWMYTRCIKSELNVCVAQIIRLDMSYCIKGLLFIPITFSNLFRLFEVHLQTANSGSTYQNNNETIF